MKICPVCRSVYSDDTKFCPSDGNPLVLQAHAEPEAAVPTVSDRAAVADGAGLPDVAPAGSEDPNAAGAPPPLPGRVDPERQHTMIYGRAATDHDHRSLADVRLPTPAPRPTPFRDPVRPKAGDAAEVGGGGDDFDGDASAARTLVTQVEDTEDPETDLDSERSAYIGKLIDGRYLVKSLIGRGGMGAVYRVEQIHLRKHMAMKLLHENLVGRKQLVSRFTREARAISRLSSAHTVMVFDFGRWGEVFYLVMELLRGEALDAMLNREGPLDAERTTHLLLQMCDSLAEAHKHGIVHRDLKPENVMLIEGAPHDDFVKILDFGLAKVKGVDDPYTIHSQKDIFGTPFYMSPEQIRAGDVDQRADVYAVGALAFRMLTGQHLFDEERSTFDILKAHLMEPPPRMSAVLPDGGIPECLEQIVAHMLEKDPANRFADMDELAVALIEAKKAGFEGLLTGLPTVAGASERAAKATDAAAAARATIETVAAPSNSPQIDAADTALQLADDESLQEHATRARRLRTGSFALGLAAFVLIGLGALVFGGVSGAGGEQEPNDMPEQANMLDSDGHATAVIGKRRSQYVADRDCFRLPSSEPGQRLRVRVTGVPNMDLVVSIVDQSGKELAAANHSRRGQGELVRYWDTAGGPAVACVTEHKIEGRVAGESLSDSYELSASVAPGDGLTESEPNDTGRGDDLPAEATIRGALDGPDDVDVFTLGGAFEGRVLRVELEPDGDAPLVAARLALLDHAGRPLTVHEIREGQITGVLAFAATARQMPDRVVVSLAGAARAIWDAREEIGIGYTVKLSLVALGDEQETEPNNTIKSATPMVLGAWHVGNADDAAGVDWFRIDAGDPLMKRIRLEANAPVGSAFWLIVRDLGTRTDLRKVRVSTRDNDQDLYIDGSGQGLLVRIERVAPEGRRRGSESNAGYRLRARWALAELPP